MLIGDFLRHSAGRSAERIALIGEETSLTYGEFDRQADRLPSRTQNFLLTNLCYTNTTWLGLRGVLGSAKSPEATNPPTLDLKFGFPA